MNKYLIKARKQQMASGWDRILQIGDIRSSFDQQYDNDEAVIDKYAGIKQCPVPYSNYYTDSQGSVFGTSGRELSTFKNNGGYVVLVVKLDSGEQTTIPVSRLTALTWLPNKDGLSDTDHIDGNKTNNAVSNLRWLSHADNLRKRAVKGGKSAVTAIELSTNKKTEYSSISACSRALGISYSTIRGLANGAYSLPSANGYYFVFSKEK